MEVLEGNKEGVNVQIGVITTEPQIGIGPSLMGVLLQDNKPAKFEGTATDWPRFERQWKEYADILDQAQPGLNDRAWLWILKPFLDSASADRLQTVKGDNPELSYDEFWEDLSRTHRRDLTDEYRRLWEELSQGNNAWLELK